jgi:soluble lytic murein transglycosylase-like protein
MPPDPDPVRDLLEVVRREAYGVGLGAGRKTASNGAFLRGLLVGALLAVAGIGACAAQTVPVQAERFRRDLIRESQAVWGMGAPVSLLAAQVHQESAWKPDAVSWAGAAGLSQFMPATAQDIGRRYGGPVNRFDPRWSLRAQSLYMRELHRQIDAINESERLAFSLSGYNGGLRRVFQRQALSADPRRCIYSTCTLNPGIAAWAQRENEAYSRRIMLTLGPIYHAAGWGGPDLFSRFGSR